MKKKVALLKKRRQKLRKKVITERDEKREINKEIKLLISTMLTRHLAEAKQMGIDRTSALEEEAAEMMIDE